MSVRAAIDRLRRADPMLVWGFGFAAVILAFTVINLAARSLWWDELFTMALADPATPHADAVTQIRSDVHLPGYFYAARLWLQLWQTSSDFALRAFNLVPYAFAAWMAVRALRERGDRPVVLWLVIFSASFGVYWYLQEARMYATMIAQALCGCLVVAEYEARRLKPVTPGYAILLALVFVLMPLGHWFSLGFAGCLLIGLSIWALVERRMQFLALFVALGVILGAVGAWWIVANTGSTIGALDNYGDWVYGGSLSLYGLRLASTDVLLFTLTLNPILIAAAALGVWLVLRSPGKHTPALIMLGSSVVVGLAILGMSLVAAMYQVRNFMWLVAPLALFSAIGLQFVLARLKFSRVRQTVAVMVTLAISLAIAPFAGRVTQLELDEWRDAGRFIASTPGCEAADIRVLAFWLDKSPTDFHYRFSQRIAGHYTGRPEQIKAVLRGEKPPIDTGSACPIVLWVIEHESRAINTVREIFGPEADGLRRQAFEGHVIFLRAEEELAASAG